MTHCFSNVSMPCYIFRPWSLHSKLANFKLYRMVRYINCVHHIYKLCRAHTYLHIYYIFAHFTIMFDVIIRPHLCHRCKCMDRPAYHDNSQHRSNESKNRSMFSRQPTSTRWTYVQCTIF